MEAAPFIFFGAAFGVATGIDFLFVERIYEVSIRVARRVSAGPIPQESPDTN